MCLFNAQDFYFKTFFFYVEYNLVTLVTPVNICGESRMKSLQKAKYFSNNYNTNASPSNKTWCTVTQHLGCEKATKGARKKSRVIPMMLVTSDFIWQNLCQCDYLGSLSIDTLLQLYFRISYFCLLLLEFRLLRLIPHFLIWPKKNICFSNFPRKFLCRQVSISIWKSSQCGRLGLWGRRCHCLRFYTMLVKAFTPSGFSSPQNWCSIKLNGAHKVMECR